MSALTLSEAVAGNDRRAALAALRDRLAQTIDSTESGRDVAALSKRLMEVMRELDSIPDPSAPDDPLGAACKAVGR